MSHRAKVQIGSDKAQHTETYSSPHTYSGSSAVPPPPTVLPDKPAISNIRIQSAVATLPERFRRVKKEHAAGSATPPDSTRRAVTMTFDVDHISPPVANMFRRLILTEVPVLAFDRVLIEENDSVVPDELLAHRIGLVPVAGPVAKMMYVTESQHTGFDTLDASRVLLFELNAEGRRDAQTTCVYSGDLRWKPLPGQEAWAAASNNANKANNDNEEEQEGNNNNNNDNDDDDRVFLVHPDILLTKLGPGQRLRLRVVAVKGLGGVHAKWSPASACFYELKTSIHLREPVRGECADQLRHVCPKGVFGVNANGEAEVVDVENCTLCRECLRQDVHPDFANKVVIEKDKTRIRFTIESIGQLHPSQIFRNALTLFAERVRDLAVRIRSTEANVTGAAAAVRPSV
ncbi:putative DNA-directed RNA polymerase, alpha subunit [Trypanosoma theileri]|uniref:Plastid-encoded RNA polymerase subunit alpha n=1 Tax=Trypanosoma theileri TaxID=67003 RepID=A0A1X0P6H8_9TRYP|nr:putative DNA-directed RNA polymerase, alpha subunit [Trypanosoma theileri]ORC92468.1 putative DNA-directed RNA polymerase, alpha subunit [Trypanosoma theileri]